MCDEPDDKRCSRCQEPLPATPEFFYRSRRTRDGLNTRCKDCCLETPFERRRRLRRQRVLLAIELSEV